MGYTIEKNVPTLSRGVSPDGDVWIGADGPLPLKQMQVGDMVQLNLADELLVWMEEYAVKHPDWTPKKRERNATSRLMVGINRVARKLNIKLSFRRIDTRTENRFKGLPPTWGIWRIE